MEYGNRSAFLTHHRRRIAVLFGLLCLGMVGLTGRLVFLMMYRADHYSEMAQDLHQRERAIKAARGRILDANGTVIAANRTVCSISVIHNQVTDSDTVIHSLCENLGMEEAGVRKKVEKRSSREIIRTNVDKETGDRIRELHLAGVKVDEDYKRYYPFDSLASKVLGFTGGDNQGIIGLEVKYENYLKGVNGMILTTTDARGIELADTLEDRVEPVSGDTLQVSLDYNIQEYAQQAAEKVMEEKQADAVVILILNPKTGEIYACVNAPEFDLNAPFTLPEGTDAALNDEEKQAMLNQMWRNRSINDTYEPGSIFKVFTASAALEEGVVKEEDTFYCPGYKLVEDRRIRCARTTGHGSETFVQGVQNSCNPVFIEVGIRLGTENFYKYFEKFGLMGKTGVDLPGEAATIMHKKENVGQVELATMSFGQSFQVTPMQMATTVCSLVNGGKRITPHFGVVVYDAESGAKEETISYGKRKRILSKETSEKMRKILETVVSEGGGKKAQIEGYRIGGKTATSQTLPRSANRYIGSFIGFAPADDPQVAAMAIIYNPQGIYYGGTIAAPVVRDIFDNILPYLGIEREENP